VQTGGNPNLVNAASAPFDFHLQGSSPAIGAGIRLAAISADFDGDDRSQIPAVTVGAYEYAPAPEITNTTRGGNAFWFVRDQWAVTIALGRPNAQVAVTVGCVVRGSGISRWVRQFQPQRAGRSRQCRYVHRSMDRRRRSRESEPADCHGARLKPIIYGYTFVVARNAPRGRPAIRQRLLSLRLPVTTCVVNYPGAESAPAGRARRINGSSGVSQASSGVMHPATLSSRALCDDRGARCVPLGKRAARLLLDRKHHHHAPEDPSRPERGQRQRRACGLDSAVRRDQPLSPLGDGCIN
jgi:hypothetical protein